MKRIFYLIILTMVFGRNAIAEISTIEKLVVKGGAGEFNCSYRRAKASKKCHVKNSEEVVANKELVSLYGDPGKSKIVKMEVLNILWPDKTRSRFAWGDSMEISNLQTKNIYGYKLKFSEWPEIDYSEGLIILDENDMEYIRLW